MEVRRVPSSFTVAQKAGGETPFVVSVPSPAGLASSEASSSVSFFCSGRMSTRWTEPYVIVVDK